MKKISLAEFFANLSLLEFFIKSRKKSELEDLRMGERSRTSKLGQTYLKAFAFHPISSFELLLALLLITSRRVSLEATSSLLVLNSYDLTTIKVVLRRISGDFSVWGFFAIVLLKEAVRVDVMLGDTFEHRQASCHKIWL